MSGRECDTVAYAHGPDTSLFFASAMNSPFLILCAAVLFGLVGFNQCSAQTPASEKLGTSAPVWASEPVARIITLAAPPKTDGDDPLADASWQTAEAIGPLSAGGSPENDDRRTEVRMILSGSTLYVGERCFEKAGTAVKPAAPDEPIWSGDSIELLFPAGTSKGFPLVHILVGASGRSTIAKHLLPAGIWGETFDEKPDPSLLTVRATTDAKGWWAVVVLPLDKLGLASPPAFANIERNLSGDNVHPAWVDLFGGRFLCPARMGRLVQATPPLKPPARLGLPATLAVGVNNLEFTDGKQTLVVEGPGTTRIERGAEGAWSADVRRPIVVTAAKPFGNDLAGPLSVELTLAVAGTAKVSVEVAQDGKSLGRKDAQLAAGKHTLDIPLANAKPGEVQIAAKAEVPLDAGRAAAFEAKHWCLVGGDGAPLDKFRAGIEKLPLRSLYRAAVADAAEWLRALQAGDGSIRWRGGRGNLGFTEWNQGAAYLFALVYKSDWPENPHRGDRRFLEAAALALDAELDPAKTQTMLGNPPNRDLEGALMAWNLIRDDVPAGRCDEWKRGFEQVIQAVVDTWLAPLALKFSDYSEEIGTGTNHYAYHAFNVWYAGRVLKHPEWEALGRDMLRRLARHEKDGQFAERRGVPASHYTWLTLHNVALYYAVSGDETVKEHVLRGANFSVALSTPAAETLSLFDGRNNDHGPGQTGDIALGLTDNGRALARVRAVRRISSDSRPSRMSPETWFYAAVSAVHFADGPEQPAGEGEYPLLDGRGVIVRRNGFLYALSAISVAPIKGLFRLDPQNAVEVWHPDAGWVLHGSNSQDQPEAGSFCRSFGFAGDKELKGAGGYLPVEGIVQRVGAGHAARLEFATFKAQVIATAIDANTFEVRAEATEIKPGGGPVLFNFFPGAGFSPQGADDVKLSADGLSIAFRNVMIACSCPVQLERDFTIYSPYAGRRGIRSKPVRAWCEIEVGKPLVLRITVAGK